MITSRIMAFAVALAVVASVAGSAQATRFSLGVQAGLRAGVGVEANAMVKDFAEGFPMVEVGATVRNFSEPMKELEALVLSGRLHHNGDPLLEWMVSNVVAHLDNKDNIFPRKESPDNKIDGVVALIMALARVLFEEEEPTRSVYCDPETAVM